MLRLMPAAVMTGLSRPGTLFIRPASIVSQFCKINQGVLTGSGLGMFLVPRLKLFFFNKGLTGLWHNCGRVNAYFRKKSLLINGQIKENLNKILLK